MRLCDHGRDPAKCRLPSNGPGERSCERTTDDQELEDRLRIAYVTAVRSVTPLGTVQIHIGADIVDRLREIANREGPNTPTPWEIPNPSMFGFPIVIRRETGCGDLLEVHAIQVIA